MPQQEWETRGEEARFGAAAGALSDPSEFPEGQGALLEPSPHSPGVRPCAAPWWVTPRNGDPQPGQGLDSVTGVLVAGDMHGHTGSRPWPPVGQVGGGAGGRGLSDPHTPEKWDNGVIAVSLP